MPSLSEHILTYRLDGALFFGAAQRFLTELTAVTDVKVVILRLPDVQVLDATGAQILGETVSELEARGITVLLKGARSEHLRTLRAVGAIDRLAHQRHLFDNLDDAIAHARLHVRRSATAQSNHISRGHLSVGRQVEGVSRCKVDLATSWAPTLRPQPAAHRRVNWFRDDRRGRWDTTDRRSA